MGKPVEIIITDKTAKTVRAAQRRLKAEGFDPGPVDGVCGIWTAKALEYHKLKCSEPHDLPENPREAVVAIAVSHVGILHKNFSSLLMKAIPENIAVESKSKYGVPFVTCCLNRVLGKDEYLPYVATSKAMLERFTWTPGGSGMPPEPGDVFGIYMQSLGQIGHCGLIVEWQKSEKFFLTAEAMHSDMYWPATDGWPRVVMRRRLKSDVAAVRRIL